MQLHLHEFDLPLRHTFTISRESIDVQKTMIVELEEDGLHGYGEATTNNYYGFTFENMAAALAAVRDEIESREFILAQISGAVLQTPQCPRCISWASSRSKSRSSCAASASLASAEDENSDDSFMMNIDPTR